MMFSCWCYPQLQILYSWCPYILIFTRGKAKLDQVYKMNKHYVHHLIIANIDLSIKLKTFTSSGFHYVTGYISEKVNSNVIMFRYGLLSTWVWWKSTVLYICANRSINISEIKSLYLVFLFSNLIGILSEYDRYNLFCLFPLTVLLGFYYLILKHLFMIFLFCISKFFPLSIPNYQPQRAALILSQ